MRRKAVIIGATSGIGKELAKILSQEGFDVGLTGRRTELLDVLASEIAGKSFVKTIDVTRVEETLQSLEELFAEMNGVDLVIINAGVGFINPEVDWQKELTTIETNVIGFTAIANFTAKRFIEQKCGHLVGISSIAAIRGSSDATAYNASKAFVSNYLEGLQHKFAKLNLPITVTDVKPGFVDTAMAQGEGLFWVAPPEKAARQIYTAIKEKRHHVYITKRWRLIGILLKILPAFVYQRL